MKKIFLFLLWVATYSAAGQAIKVQLDATAVAVSQDRNGNLYYADARGNIRKLDPTGSLEQLYSPTKPGGVTLLDAWFTVKISAFFKDYQQMLQVNRLLGSSESLAIQSSEIGFATVAAPASDGTAWLFDQSDFSIKKYDLLSKQLILNNPLALILPEALYDITYIREYENRLFLADAEKGVYIFDLMGNPISLIEAAGVEWFCFFKEELIYIDFEGEIVAYHLYNGTSRTLATPVAKPDFFLRTPQAAISIKGDVMWIEKKR